MNTKWDSFILANYKILTIEDIVYELGITRKQLYPICKRLNIRPVTRGQQVINFISENSTWSIDKLSRTLNLQQQFIRRYAKDAGIELINPYLISKRTWKHKNSKGITNEIL